MNEEVAKQVLILDQDNEETHSFANLLQFIGCESRIETPDVVTREMAVQPVDCIFSNSSEAALEQIRRLGTPGQAVTPVVFLGNLSELPQRQQGLFSGQIGYRPSYAELTRLLRHMSILKMHGQSYAHTQNSRVPDLVGDSHSMQRIRRMIEQVSDSMASVLILGDSGTGKEVVARNIHYYSNRRDKPFVPINCGAIPAELLESELFGHEKGAFTGAISARQGRFELAEGGVIFLDEIGDMPLSMQVKLLRVLQERCFERVGSNQTQQTDVRVIAATHRNLEQLIETGKFREDLYFRLNVFPIEVPSLSERPEDIPLLTKELINRFEAEKRGTLRLTAAATRMLMAYEWPGNVRELANLIERMMILFPHGVVDARDLPDKYQNAEWLPVESQGNDVTPGLGGLEQALSELGNQSMDMKQFLAEIETRFIEESLVLSQGVVARAADMLGMRRTTLVEKMRKYGIERFEMAS